MVAEAVTAPKKKRKSRKLPLLIALLTILLIVSFLPVNVEKAQERMKEQMVKYGIITGPGGGGTAEAASISDHNLLGNLNWSAAGHVIDQNVAIGAYNLSAASIVASPDADAVSHIGRASIGGISNNAVFSHYDMFSLTDFALMQENGGNTYLNAPSGGGLVYFSIGGIPLMRYGADSFTFNNLPIKFGQWGSEDIEINRTSARTLTISSDYGSAALIIDGNLSISGNLMPASTLTSDIGSGAQRWDDLYVSDISSDTAAVSGDVHISGNVEVDGNLTRTSYYGGMWYHNHTGTLINFATSSLFYHLFFVNFTHSNGFAFTGGFGLNSTLIAQNTGTYLISYMAMGDGQNNHVYRTTVFINETNKDNCENHRKMAAGGDIITQTGTCLLKIYAGDKISLRTADDGGTGTGNYYGANFELTRIGA